MKLKRFLDTLDTHADRIVAGTARVEQHAKLWWSWKGCSRVWEGEAWDKMTVQVKLGGVKGMCGVSWRKKNVRMAKAKRNEE